MSLFKAVIRGTYFNQICENVIHFSDNNTGSSEDCAQKLRDVWCPTVRNLQNANFGWFFVSVSKLPESSTQWEAPVQLTFASQPGSLSGAGAHPALAWIFSLRKACAGRKCRGRIYLPGVHGESVVNGQAQDGAFTAANVVAGLMHDRFHASGNAFTGYSLAVAERAEPYAHGTVEQIIVRRIFGIQRRRNINVGS